MCDHADDADEEMTPAQAANQANADYFAEQQEAEAAECEED